MGVCEPGQGGNAAAISNTFMCLGEPPRLSPTPADDSETGWKLDRPSGASRRDVNESGQRNGEPSRTR